MARVRASGRWTVPGLAGSVASGWKVYTYIAGTSTPKDTYTTFEETAANTNPVILDSRGEETIYWRGTYKVVVKDENDNAVWTEDNYGEGENQVITGNYNTVKNGSFETDAIANGEPDEWTIVDYSTGSHSLDTTDQFHGLTSLKFTSTGLGGGYATTVFFEVQELKDLTFQYSLRSSVADVRNVVDVIWYTSAKTTISTTNIYDDSTTNPTAWTQFQNTVTPPSTARYGQLRLYGCHSSDTTLGSTWFDAISAVELFGTMASQDKDTVDITGGDAILDNFSLNLPITDNYGDDTVTNGVFDADTDWTKGTGWTIGSNVASSDGTQVADALLTQTQTTIDTYDYLISFEVTAYTAGNVALQFNSVEVITDKAAIGTYTATVTASGVSNDLDIVADLDFIGSIDNVSVVSTTYRGVVGETSLTTDKIYSIRINASNLGASTLALDGQPIQNIKLLDGNDPYGEALKIGMDAKFFFDNTDFILLNPDPYGVYSGKVNAPRITAAGINAASGFIDKGTGDDGSKTVSSSENLFSGEYHYTDLTINSGQTLGVSSSTGGLVIRCTGTVTITGNISADGKGAAGGASALSGASNSGETGFLGGSGGGGGTDNSFTSGSGGSINLRNIIISGGVGKTGAAAGNNGTSLAATTEAVRSISSFGNDLIGLYGGGGGGGGSGTIDPGNGAKGGGFIIIIADTIDFQSGAVLTADGSTGSSSVDDGGGGGGGGGFVLLAARDITNNGAITTTGGSGGTGINAYNGGAGGAGYSLVVTI